MENKSKKNSLFPEINHVGVVVRDIERTMKYLSALGIGPFESLPGKSFRNRIWRGKPIEKNLKTIQAQLGPVALELMEPIGGESPYKEFLEKRGEGIYHIGCVVKDLNRRLEELAQIGVKVVLKGEGDRGSGFAYLDTEEHCGFNLELIQWDIEE